MNLLTFLKDKLAKQHIPVDKEAAIAATKNPAEHETFRRVGATTTAIQQMVQQLLVVQADRQSIYNAIDQSLTHPIMAAAVELYTDVATPYSSLHNATLWCTSKSKEYQRQAEKLFEIINLEEVIGDWTWQVVTFGDLFVRVIAEPGVGIVAIQDDYAPIDIARADYMGKLIGFIETPQGYTTSDLKLESPWSMAHFRLLGAIKRRPMTNDQTLSQFKTISIITPDQRRASSKYGVSVLNNALTAYKRLKMVEDSLLYARLSKGRLTYIHKIGVDSNMAPEAIAALIDEYTAELKRVRSIDTTTGAQLFNERTDLYGSVMEDVVVPVWGDVNQVTTEKLGGETDIKYLADLDEYKNQLIVALRTPLQLIGGYVKDLPSSLGQSSLERLDIRFSRQGQRVKRAMIGGFKRLFQIHLAFQKMDADLSLFDFHMAEGSSAEEEELKDALEKGVDVVDKVSDMIIKHTGEQIDKVELLNYLNQKILKLNDLDLQKLRKNVEASVGPLSTPEAPEEEAPPPTENPFRQALRASVETSDLRALTPLKEEVWKSIAAKVKING